MNPGQNVDEEIEIQPEKQGLTTRYRGMKHVPVYKVDISKNINLKNIKSILTKTNYKFNSNSDISNFRGVDQASFLARKRALENHQCECKLTLCDICSLSRQVKDYRWDPSCLGRYHQRNEIHEKGRNLRQKYVTLSNQ